MTKPDNRLSIDEYRRRFCIVRRNAYYPDEVECRYCGSDCREDCSCVLDRSLPSDAELIARMAVK